MRLYSFAKSSVYPTLGPLIAGRINVALIRTHWAEILRVAASIRQVGAFSLKQALLHENPFIHVESRTIRSAAAAASALRDRKFA